MRIRDWLYLQAEFRALQVHSRYQDLRYQFWSVLSWYLDRLRWV